MKTKYFIDREESGDWYLIPFDKHDEWVRWTDGPGYTSVPDDNYFDEVPEFAEYISSPSDVVFENPIVN